MRAPAYDVILAGGGFAGLVTATALARLGLRLCIVEPHATAPDVLRGELLHARGVRALEELGLAGAMRAAGSVDVYGFAAYAPGSSTPVVLPYSKGYGMGLEHRAMVDALRGEVEQYPNVTWMMGPRASDVIRQNGRVVGLRCAGGEEFRAALVIAADGRLSKVRKALGIPTSVELLSHTLATSLHDVALPVPGHGHVFVGAVGPMLAYPFGARSVRVQLDVSVRAAKNSGGLVPYLLSEYLPHLTPQLRRPLRDALLEKPLMASANHAIYTEFCVAPGAALVGDAAGCSHPLTATGMTIALHDAQTLAATVQKLGLGDDALLAYQKARSGFVRARETFAHALYEVFRADDVGARALRSAVFDYWKSDRSRRASMDILTGEESGLRAFVGEYLRVVGTATRSTLPRPPTSLEPMAGMLLAAARSMSFATDRVLARLATERMQSLVPFPVDDPNAPPVASRGSRRLRTLLREHARSRARRPVRERAQVS